MTFVEGPAGPLEVLVVGHGSPVTVFAHGLASSIAETRPFGSGVHGTRVFFHFRGHGASVAPSLGWTYAAVADELTAVSSAYGARRGLGVSLGAGALLAAACAEPAAYERLVFVLPGALGRRRDDLAVRRMHEMARLVAAGDVEGLAADLVAEQPDGARQRPDVAVWARRRAARLVGSGVVSALRELPTQHPIDAGTDLSVLTMPVLVVGQDGDAAHPADLARELALRLPNALLSVFDADGLVWAHRAELRSLISTFLNTPDP